MDNSKKPILKKDKEVLLADGLPAELPDDLKHNQCQKKAIFLLIVILSLSTLTQGIIVGPWIAFCMYNILLVLFWRDSSVFFSEREMSPVKHLQIAFVFFLLMIPAIFIGSLI